MADVEPRTAEQLLRVRLDVERRAVVVFGAALVTTAAVVAGLLVSGWHGGSLDNRVEPVFWAGALLGALGIVLLGVAAMPGGRNDRLALGITSWLLRLGILLLLVAPTLCILAVFLDYWI